MAQDHESLESAFQGDGDGSEMNAEHSVSLWIKWRGMNILAPVPAGARSPATDEFSLCSVWLRFVIPG